jgi:hypothetical protein
MDVERAHFNRLRAYGYSELHCIRAAAESVVWLLLGGERHFRDIKHLNFVYKTVRERMFRGWKGVATVVSLLCDSDEDQQETALRLHPDCPFGCAEVVCHYLRGEGPFTGVGVSETSSQGM